MAMTTVGIIFLNWTPTVTLWINSSYWKAWTNYITIFIFLSPHNRCVNTHTVTYYFSNCTGCYSSFKSWWQLAATRVKNMAGLYSACHVHPVVLIAIVDSYERRSEDARRVIGTLLGNLYIIISRLLEILYQHSFPGCQWTRHRVNSSQVTSSLSRFFTFVTTSPCDDFTLWRLHCDELYDWCLLYSTLAVGVPCPSVAVVCW